MRFYDREYEGLPLWEIGRPQPEFVALERTGEIVGRVLDVGCGTGENALFFAEHGHPTWGVDFAPNAIRRAVAKAEGRKSPVEFRVHSALDLASLGERFDTVTDCGLFHTFLDPHRLPYSESVRSILPPGGRFHLLCFSEEEPTDWGGPRRISQAELRTTFSEGWELRGIRPARFEVRLPNVAGRAWLASFVRK
jgi:cyclopropane fatty-acyl-phospholipid synthase-like methyltransferase